MTHLLVLQFSPSINNNTLPKTRLAPQGSEDRLTDTSWCSSPAPKAISCPVMARATSDNPIERSGTSLGQRHMRPTSVRDREHPRRSASPCDAAGSSTCRGGCGRTGGNALWWPGHSIQAPARLKGWDRHSGPRASHFCWPTTTMADAAR